jgi:hypothetical protein
MSADDILTRMRGAAIPNRRETVRPRRSRVVTVDLDEDRHRRLREYALEYHTAAAQVVRALLDQLDADPVLAGTVAERLSQ